MPIKNAPERRQFGRRHTYLHGWVSVPGRPRLPCIVSDVSLSLMPDASVLEDIKLMAQQGIGALVDRADLGRDVFDCRHR